MPVCDHCQTPYVQGQRYCKHCGSFLLAVEEEKAFCPECGTRVSPKQNFCHDCDAPLKEEGQASKPLQPEPLPPLLEEPVESSGPLGMRKWVMALILGAALVLGFLFILFLTRPSDPPRPKSMGQLDQKTALQPPALQPPPGSLCPRNCQAATDLTRRYRGPPEAVGKSAGDHARGQSKKGYSLIYELFFLFIPGIRQTTAKNLKNLGTD